MHPDTNKQKVNFGPWMAGLFLVALGLYITTMPPEFLFDDNPEFIASAHVLGVPHPPGYPLISIMGKFFSLAIPHGIPLGVNLFSAFAGAAAAVFLGFTLWRLTGRAPVSAVFPVFFIVSPVFWSQSIEAEVYASNALITAALLNLALDTDDRPRAGILAAIGVFGGIAITTHYTALLVLPVIAVYVIAANRRRLADIVPSIVPVLFMFLLGLTAFMYLPLRGAANPPVSWGDTTTFSGFMHHLRGVETMGQAARVALAEKGRFIADYFRLASHEAPWPCMLLLAPGIVGLVRRRGRGALIAGLFLATFAGFLFTLNYRYGPRTAYVVSFFYITSFFFMFAVIGLGAAELANLLRGNRGPLMEKIILLIPLTLITYGASMAWGRMAKLHDAIAPNYGRNILLTLPKDSAIFSFDITESFPLTNLRDVYGMRRDVLLLGKPGDAFKEMERKAAAPEVTSKERLAAQERIDGLIDETGTSRPIFFTMGALVNRPGKFLVIDGVIYRMQSFGAATRPQSMWQRYDLAGLDLNRTDPWDYDYLTRYVVSKYYLLMGADQMSRDLLQKKEPVQAEALFAKLRRFNPDSQFLRVSLATIYINTSKVMQLINPDLMETYEFKALPEYEAAMKLPPEEAGGSSLELGIYNNAGGLYRDQFKWAEAIGALEKAVSLAPNDYFTHFQLGRTHYDHAEWLNNTGRREDIPDACKSAVAELERTDALGGGNDSVYSAMGWCYDQLSEFGGDVKYSLDQAQMYYRKALSYVGNTPFPKKYYEAGEFFADKLQKPAEAAGLFEKYLELAKQNSGEPATAADEVHLKLANIYCATKNYDDYRKAISHLTAASMDMEKLTPYEQSAIYYYGGKAYEGVGEPSSALIMLANGADVETDLPEIHRDFGLLLADWSYDANAMSEKLSKSREQLKAISAKDNKEKALKRLDYYQRLISDADFRNEIALEELRRYLDRQPGAWDTQSIEKKIAELQNKIKVPTQ